MALRESLKTFQDASLRRRVALRFATEFPNDKALKQYLKDHPDADPSNHSVKKKGPAVDTSNADSAASSSESRYDSNKRTFQDLKKQKDDKKFNAGYKALYEAGEKAADATEKAIKNYEGALDNLRGKAKQGVQDLLDLMDQGLRQWKINKIDHHSAKDKRKQLPNTYGYAQQLEAYLRALPKVLKGDYNTQIDDSWREH